MDLTGLGSKQVISFSTAFVILLSVSSLSGWSLLVCLLFLLVKVYIQQATQLSPSLFPALIPIKSKGTNFLICSGQKVRRTKMMTQNSESEEIRSNESLEKSLSFSIKIL